MLKQVLLPAIIGAVAVVGTVSADTVEYTDTVDLSATNWDDSVSISRFDETLGDLISVSFELVGHAEGSANFESLDAAPATVTMTLAAEIELLRPDLSALVTVLPLVDTVDDVTAFDGVIDFGGTSGKSYDGLQADETDSFVSTDPADFALFTGTGDIVLPCNATGASTGSGAGNLILQFSTSASSLVRVVYEYISVVPTEETTWSQLKSDYR